MWLCYVFYFSQTSTAVRTNLLTRLGENIENFYRVNSKVNHTTAAISEDHCHKLLHMAAKHEKGEDTSSSDEEEAGKEIPQHDADSIEDQQEVRLLDNTSSCLENSNQDDDNYPPLGWTTSGRRIQQCTDDIPTGIGDDNVCTTDLCEEEECRAAQENDYVDQLTDDINVFISLLIISLYLRALSNNFIN
ncbi:uncharacterized protein [Pocillopora verrucosa]|uniref:uncharacterized protein isoform X1 n=2 Tax=Pocillopora verrucosa TaxID=203993 RepID=UPI0033426472